MPEGWKVGQLVGRPALLSLRQASQGHTLLFESKSFWTPFGRV